MAEKKTGKTMSQGADFQASVIKKQIKRTIKTGEFESLVIEDGFEEIIEWKTLAERDKKLDHWDTILLQRFKKSHDRILDELGFEHKKAYFKNMSEETRKRLHPKIEAAEAVKTAKAKGRTLDLDDLDTVG